MREYTRRELLDKCIIITLVAGTIGIAAKLTTLLEQAVYFPLFPNILDWAFISISAIYLGIKAWRRT